MKCSAVKCQSIGQCGLVSTDDWSKNDKGIRVSCTAEVEGSEVTRGSRGGSAGVQECRRECKMGKGSRGMGWESLQLWDFQVWGGWGGERRDGWSSI